MENEIELKWMNAVQHHYHNHMQCHIVQQTNKQKTGHSIITIHFEMIFFSKRSCLFMETNILHEIFKKKCDSIIQEKTNLCNKKRWLSFMNSFWMNMMFVQLCWLRCAIMIQGCFDAFCFFFLVGFNNENGGCKVLIVEKFAFIVVGIANTQLV